LKLDPGAVLPGPVVISVDPGQREGEHNSFTAVQVWRVLGDAYFLVDQWRGRSKYPELRSRCKSLVREHQASAVLIENNGVGTALIGDLAKRSAEIVPISPRASKIDRLRECGDAICNMKITVPGNASWVNDYIAEFLDFPNGRFTDQVDATTQFLEFMASRPVLQMPVRRGLACATLSNGAQAQPISPKDPRVIHAPHGVLVRGRRWWY
jgi:predicted phage terminase large subunit-like protein